MLIATVIGRGCGVFVCAVAPPLIIIVPFADTPVRRKPVPVSGISPVRGSNGIRRTITVPVWARSPSTTFPLGTNRSSRRGCGSTTSLVPCFAFLLYFLMAPHIGIGNAPPDSAADKDAYVMDG